MGHDVLSSQAALVTGKNGLIRCKGGVADGYEAVWTGPWPPPEELVAVTGKVVDMVTVTVATDENRSVMEAAYAQDFTMQRYRQASASRLTDDEIATMTHVVRMADYELDGPWSP